MRLPLLLTLSASSLACFALGAVACDSSSDAGSGTDAATDSGGFTTDSSTPDGGGTTDAADASTCTKTTPSGFSTVADGTGKLGTFGEEVAMALDENGDPMIAYVHFEPAGTSDSVKDSILYFTRWDHCSGTWTTPVNVDVVGAISDGGPRRQVAIARDAMTGAIGLAFAHIGPPPPSFVNGTGALYVAQSSDGGKTWTKSQLSQHSQIQEGDIHTATNPGLAMYGGKMFVAYAQDNVPCDADAASETCNGWYAEGTPAAWTRSTLPNLPGGFGVRTGSPVSVQLDSANKPAVVYEVTPDTGYNTQIAFWRPGTAAAVKVTDSNGVQNDDSTHAFAFDGLKPRVAALLVNDETIPYQLQFLASDTGATWGPPVNVPEDGTQHRTDFVSLAVNASGGLAVSANGGNAGGDGTCGGPFVARSTNGTTFTACGADTAKSHNATTGLFLASAYDSKGKLVIAFKVTDNASDTLHPGVALWHEP